MLLGLNTGMTQHEIAQLRKVEVDLGRGYVERRRYKTGVYGRWKLWPETADLLGAEMDGDARQPLALLNDEGLPLVKYHDDHRNDSVGLSWRRMVERVEGVRPLSFKFLRKTGSDLVRKVGGKEMAEAFLAHAERSLSRVYNNRDFERLDAVLTQVRGTLQQMFETPAVSTT
jgi:integrase